MYKLHSDSLTNFLILPECLLHGEKTIKPTQSITSLSPHVGAEAIGFDLRSPLDAPTVARLNDALIDHVALVIRNQQLDASQYARAMHAFGEIMPDQIRRYLVPGEPLVSVLSNLHLDSSGKPAQVAANATWHTDHTNQLHPPKYTCLYAVELPDSGTETWICSARAAYESLDDAWKTRLDGMQTANVLISSTRSDVANPDVVRDQRERAQPPMLHPLVRTHPERGTRALWFHKTKTENVDGMTPSATQAFLDELLELMTSAEYVYKHQWQPGDLLMIDNRSALHRANHQFDQSQHRLLYRMLIKGDRPV